MYSFDLIYVQTWIRPYIYSFDLIYMQTWIRPYIYSFDLIYVQVDLIYLTLDLIYQILTIYLKTDFCPIWRVIDIILAYLIFFSESQSYGYVQKVRLLILQYSSIRQL